MADQLSNLSKVYYNKLMEIIPFDVFIRYLLDSTNGSDRLEYNNVLRNLVDDFKLNEIIVEKNISPESIRKVFASFYK